jgi:hypothetical protein
VQVEHVYRIAHASVHAFPAHASLIFVDIFSMFWHSRHGETSWRYYGLTGLYLMSLCKLGSEGMPALYKNVVI